MLFRFLACKFEHKSSSKLWCRMAGDGSEAKPVLLGRWTGSWIG